jgi:3-deoxy-D-manno-octulosonic-acid transferase
MFLLYNFVLTLLTPIWAPWMLWRTLQRKEGPIWRERLGNYSIRYKKGAKRIWVHAVSVGEVVAAIPILRELKQRLPDWEIILSVTTSSGHKTARERAEGLYDHLYYFPIDVARFQMRAMERVRPKVVAIMETELWYNFLWCAKALGATTMLVNGRVSDRSFPRAMRLRWFYKTLLKMVDRCFMQTEKDAQRIKELGAREASVVGNSKFDEAAEGLDADPNYWRKELAIPDGKKVIVIGSTRGEEEERFVLDALAKIDLGDVVVVHAPRHLERVPRLMEMATEQVGQVSLRTQGGGGNYIILDTYGELSEIYSIADIVVVGGGFENLGGQNLIQPLAHGKPVLHGPHMQNFSEVSEAAVAAGASKVCASPVELADALQSLLLEGAARKRMGEAAASLIRGNSGAASKYAEAIARAATEN